MSVPVVLQYQRALDRLRREGSAPATLKKMSELISLLDLTTTLVSDLTSDEILESALLIVMGELGVGRGALLLHVQDDLFDIGAGRGLRVDGPRRVRLPLTLECPLAVADDTGVEAFGQLGLELFWPVGRGGRVSAAVGLGPRAAGAFGPDELGFLASVGICGAHPIEAALAQAELRRVNARLSASLYQLRNLLELTRELTSSFDEEAIKRLVVTTLMGQLAVSRAVLFLTDGEGGLVLAHEGGTRDADGWRLLRSPDALQGLAGMVRATEVGGMGAGAVRDELSRRRMGLAVPLRLGDRHLGLLAAGERPRADFTAEERDFAETLAGQAAAAIEGVRLHDVLLAKQHQDRELQIAREIQQRLLPTSWPPLAGYDLAALSRPCREVGGDYYDVVPLEGDRVALVVADVSGKGTPASILMASVHASSRAMAGTAAPARIAERLNLFLYENTQDSRYVTLFFGELDRATGTIRYVNAGHVTPLLLRGQGAIERLEEGGPVLGLLERPTYLEGEVSLGPGDLLAVFTDGATEALSPTDEEWGEARLAALLGRRDAASAEDTVRAVFAAVQDWCAPSGPTDDLTALILLRK